MKKFIIMLVIGLFVLTGCSLKENKPEDKNVYTNEGCCSCCGPEAETCITACCVCREEK